MVNQIPGFQLDDGDSTRGFSSSGGNILLNDRRPSTKQDLLSDTLSRIPSSQVERIEIVRSQVRDIDLQGQSVVANVILREADSAAVRWRGSYRYNVEYGVTAEAGISVSDRWAGVEYNAGLDLRDFTRGDFTPQDVLDGNGDLIERRIDNGGIDGKRGSVNLNARKLLGDTFVRLNLKLAGDMREGGRNSERTPSTLR